MLDILKRLTEITAPSGSENLLYELVKKEIEPFVDEIKTDALGNLIARKKGSGKKVMYCAHLDEIGLIANYVTDEGFIKVGNIGAVNPYCALSSRVRFTNGTVGVVYFDAKEDTTIKNLKIADLYIDVGATDKASAQKLVPIGTTAGFLGDYTVLEKRIVSKSLDDRAGCAVLIDAIKKIKNSENDLYFVFTYGEELGLRGAKTAAFTIRPDYCVAIDVTRTGDCPGKFKMATTLGGGAAIKIKDSYIMCHPYMKKFMEETAKKHNIPYQFEVLEVGGTDAGAVHIIAEGAISGVISIPTRYIHTVSEMADKDDLLACSELACKMAEEGF